MTIMHISSADRSLTTAKSRMPVCWFCRNTTKIMEILSWQALGNIPLSVWFRPFARSSNIRHGRKASLFWKFNSIIQVLYAADAEQKSTEKVQISSAKTVIAAADI